MVSSGHINRDNKFMLNFDSSVVQNFFFQVYEMVLGSGIDEWFGIELHLIK